MAGILAEAEDGFEGCEVVEGIPGHDVPSGAEDTEARRELSSLGGIPPNALGFNVALFLGPTGGFIDGIAPMLPRFALGVAGAGGACLNGTSDGPLVSLKKSSDSADAVDDFDLPRMSKLMSSSFSTIPTALIPRLASSSLISAGLNRDKGFES